MKAALLETNEILVGTGEAKVKIGPDHPQYNLILNRLRGPRQYQADPLAWAVADASSQVELNPTDEQKKAGNYKKGHLTIQGLPITIENPAGGTRSGKDKDGKEWRVEMRHPYGYLKRTESEADGDHLDVFIGPMPSSEIVFVVDQLGKDGHFDESKVMQGFHNEAEAKAAYLSNYAPGWKGFGGIKALTMEAFKEWLESGDTGRPIEEQVIRYSKHDLHELSVEQLIERVRKLGPYLAGDILTHLDDLLMKNPQLRQQISLHDLAYIKAMVQKAGDRQYAKKYKTDQPASLFGGHDVSDEPRDESGKWTTGADKSGGENKDEKTKQDDKIDSTETKEKTNVGQAEPGTGSGSGESERGGDFDRGTGGDDGGTGNQPPRPRILTIRPEHTRPGNPDLVPEPLRQHLNEAQIQGSALAIEAMEKHGGFVLADGTGVGKTRQQLAIAKTFADKGKKVLIVSPSEVIKPNWNKGTMAGSFANDSQAMGIDAKLIKGDAGLEAGKIHLTTYNELSKIKDHIDKNTVVLFDESHFMKNATSARSKAGAEVMAKAGSVLYATATPGDKPVHIAHLVKANIFGNIGKSATFEKLGMKLVDQHIGKGQTRKVWQIDPKVGFMESARRISGLFDQMTKDGLMIKREMSMDNVHVGLDRVSLSAEEHAAVQKAFDDKFSQTNGNKAVALMAARLHQEPFKVPATVKMVQEELAAGRHPVVFLGRVNDIVDDEDDESESSVQSVGTVKALKAALIASGIPESDIGELHGGATKTADQKKNAMEDFQSGKKKIMLATIQSGGTGINLDDTAGDKPRSLIMMTPPFTANDMAQAFGRVNRLNTKSNVHVRGVLADTDIDDWNANLLEKKFKTPLYSRLHFMLPPQRPCVYARFARKLPCLFPFCSEVLIKARRRANATVHARCADLSRRRWIRHFPIARGRCEKG